MNGIWVLPIIVSILILVLGGLDPAFATPWGVSLNGNGGIDHFTEEEEYNVQYDISGSYSFDINADHSIQGSGTAQVSLLSINEFCTGDESVTVSYSVSGSYDAALDSVLIIFSNSNPLSLAFPQHCDWPAEPDYPAEVYDETVTLPSPFNFQHDFGSGGLQMGVSTSGEFSVGNANFWMGSTINSLGSYPAADSEDASPPALVDFSFTPSTVDVSSGPATVQVTIHATDDVSGIDYVSSYFISPSGEQRVYFSTRNLVSGTINDGVYSDTMTVPQFSEAGTWATERICLRDNLVKDNCIYTSELQAAGFPTQLTVSSGAPDTSPPALVDFSFTPSTVDVSSGPATVQVTIHATDDVSGIDNVSITFLSPSGDQRVHFSTRNLVSGTINDGVFSDTMTVPQFSEAGTWTTDRVCIRDNLGKDNCIYNSELQAAGFPTHLTVGSGGQDTTPPVVSVPSDITKSTTSSGMSVTYSATATDDVDGSITPTCTHASGSTFVIGATTVTCSATDSAGNTGTASFNVIVKQSVIGTSITIGSASPFTGSQEQHPNYGYIQGASRPYDTTNNLAFQGTLAKPTVASSSIFTDPTGIHRPEFANDGFYGNGKSWIPTDSILNSWIKVDLGGDFVIDTITFGRDRLGFYDDRDPGQFTVSTSLNDAVYANGNNANDSSEYTQIVDSSLVGFSGIINGPETIQVSFDPVNARFIKLEFTNPGVSIDEIQVFGEDKTTITDTTPPVVSVPSDITKSTASSSGMSVAYSATATDDVDGSITPTCTHASGSTFVIGATTVTCSATDSSGNTGTASFTVTVNEFVEKIITVTTDKSSYESGGDVRISGVTPYPTEFVRVKATYPSGAFIDFNIYGTDVSSDGTYSRSINFAPKIGSFVIQVSPYNYPSITASTTFEYTDKLDRVLPVVSVPSDITKSTTSSGMSVTYSATATDDVDGSITPTCTPASGSTFVIGATTVTCSATDSAGNTGTASFTVTVKKTIGTNLKLLFEFGSYTASETDWSRDYKFSSIREIQVDGSGNIHVYDYSGYLKKFDSTGIHLNTLDLRSYDIGYGGAFAIDSSGNYYIPAGVTGERENVKSRGGIYKFDPSGNLLSVFGTESINSDDPSYVMSDFNNLLAIDNDGKIYTLASNKISALIRVYDSSHNLLFEFGEKGSGDGQLGDRNSGPTTLDLDSTGRIYLGYWNSQKIQVFDPAGNFLYKVGSACFMWYPTYPGKICVDPDGTGPLELGDGQFSGVKDVAIDSSDRIFVTDPSNQRVQMFDSDGKFLTKFVISDDARTASSQTVDNIAVDNAGKIYVGFNGKITVYAYSLSTIPSGPSDQDSTPPVLSVPQNIVVGATSSSGAVVDFDVSASDNEDPNPTISCSHESGSTFPLGIATVKCTATDSSGNSADDYFSVSVLSKVLPELDDLKLRYTFLIGATNYGIAVDSTGKIYLADGRAGNIYVYDQSEGKVLETIPHKGVKDIAFDSKGELHAVGGYNRAIVIDASDNRYITNTKDFNVSIYDSSGNLIKTFGERGSGEGQFGTPRAIAVDSTGKIYVVGQGYGSEGPQVSIFDSDGNFISYFGSYCQFPNRETPVPEPACVDPDGVGPLEPGDGQLHAVVDIVIDNKDRIFVWDNAWYGPSRIQIFDTSGKYLGKLLTPPGRESGYVDNPALTTDKLGNIYVQYNGISVFGKIIEEIDIDTEPPQITIPDDINDVTAEHEILEKVPEGIYINAEFYTCDRTDTCPDKKKVYFKISVTDNVDPSPKITCDWRTSQFFPLGETLVTCTGTDASGNSASDSFTVTITRGGSEDIIPPTLILPEDIIEQMTGVNGAIVNFDVTAVDDIDPDPTVTCTPLSGSQFAIGVTTVKCTAIDSSGNSATDSFTISVTGPRELYLAPPVSPINEGETVKFSGQLTAGITLEGMTIQIKDENDLSGSVITSAVTDSNGEFSTTWNSIMKDEGSYDFYAVVEGDPETTSAVYGVIVKQPIEYKPIRVSTDKEIYLPGDDLKVSGTATPDEEITLTLETTERETVAEQKIRVSSSGSYSAVLHTWASNIDFGEYVIVAWTTIDEERFDYTFVTFLANEPTVFETKIVMNRPTGSAVLGDPVTFTGQLSTIDDQPIVGGEVAIATIKDQNKIVLESGTTDSSGRFSITWIADNTGLPNNISIFSDFAGSQIFKSSVSEAFSLILEIPNLSIFTEKETYELNDSMVVFGNGIPNDTITFKITREDGKLDIYPHNAETVSDSGTYSAFFGGGALLDLRDDGTHTITAISSDYGITASTSFNVKTPVVIKTTNIVGEVFFTFQGTKIPLAGIKTILTVSPNQKVAYSDSDGSFAFENVPYDKRNDYYIHFEMSDGNNFNLIDGMKYDIKSKSKPLPIKTQQASLRISENSPVTGFGFNLDTIEPYDKAHSFYINGMFFTHTNVVEFYKKKLGENAPIIDVYLFDKKGSYYTPTNLRPSDGLAEEGFRDPRIGIENQFPRSWISTVGMEYTHYLQEYSYRNTYGFDRAAIDANHYGFANPSSADSWVEGVGSFMPAVIGDWLGYENEAGKFGGRDLERNTIKPDSLYYYYYNENAGKLEYWLDEETVIAGILWDLYDSKRDGENVSLSINKIWNLIKGYDSFCNCDSNFDYKKKFIYNESIGDKRHIKYFKDFYRYVVENSGVNKAKIDKVFALHGIPQGEFKSTERPDRN